MCTTDHAALKRDAVQFAAATTRLPHIPHTEAYQDGADGERYWMRNCAGCRTTLLLEVTL